MLINQLKNIYFKYYSNCVYLQLAYHLYKLFLLPEAFENISLMMRYRYNTLIFVRIISSYCFMTSAASSGFSTFSACSFNPSVSTVLLVVNDSSGLFLFLLCLVVFSEPPHSYKQKVATIPSI